MNERKDAKEPPNTPPEADILFIISPAHSAPLSSHQQDVQTNQVSFCWSGEKVFATTGSGRIRILSYPELEPLLHLGHGDERHEFSLEGHTSSCLTAELQPTSRYLATGGSDSIIALWDTTDWLCQRTCTNMVGPVRSLSMSSSSSVHVVGLVIL